MQLLKEDAKSFEEDKANGTDSHVRYFVCFDNASLIIEHCRAVEYLAGVFSALLITLLCSS